MEKEKVFAKGFSFKRNDNAPEFVVGRLSVKIEEAIEFMKQHDNKGWVNLNIKKSQGGAYYLELDTYQPAEKTQQEQKTTYTPPATEKPEDLPF
jgi:hypothetical protein